MYLWSKFVSTKALIQSGNKFVGLACLAGLVACNSSGGGSGVDDALQIESPSASNVSTVPQPDAIQDPRAYCPKILLRDGTQVYDVYPDGTKAEDENASKLLKYRSTITETVRECNSAGQYLNIKVGVRGRYLSGPKGDTGAFNMPIRVAVTRGEEVLYSQLHQVPADIPVGRRNGNFAYVDQNISILKPENPNILIYVGFDEGPYDTK